MLDHYHPLFLLWMILPAIVTVNPKYIEFKAIWRNQVSLFSTSSGENVSAKTPTRQHAGQKIPAVMVTRQESTSILRNNEEKSKNNSFLGSRTFSTRRYGLLGSSSQGYTMLYDWLVYEALCMVEIVWLHKLVRNVLHISNLFTAESSTSVRSFELKQTV